MRRRDRAEETETLIKRLDILDRLCDSPAHVRDLVGDTDHSRRTITRAIGELEAMNFVERGDDGIEATTAGLLARDRLDTFLADLDDIFVAEAVIDPLPSDAGIRPEIVAGGDAMLATEPASYRPLERVHDDMIDADRYRALVPTLEDARHVRLLYEHVVTDGNPAELVVTPAVFETLREEFPRRMAAMAETDGFCVFVGDVPPFVLCLFDREDGLDSPPASVAHVVVLNEGGGVHGAIRNDAETAVEWAEERYKAYRSEATDRTDSLVADTDGGVESADSTAVGTAADRAVPVSLEREGFVEINVSFFGDESVADPSTAWRAGLSLAEVHTGYAIERIVDDSVDDGAGGTGEKLSSTLTAALSSGTNCVVLGPPGSGKSTVCKQVACRWYREDRGTVLYREGDRGRSFSAVDDLVDTALDADGHTLVVVEDAVRPNAEAIFEAIDRIDHRDGVTVLLDARETEWRRSTTASVAATDLAVHHVPPMSEADCEQLVDRFARTTERSVDVPTAQLWAAVYEEAATGESRGTHELLRVIQRLSSYADPLADGPTALEDAVASVYEAVADDEVALSVCIVANALNAAGIGVERGLLLGAVEDDRFDAADTALDALDGQVIFARPDGSYRTVHEEWSVTFLAHLLDADETAAVRFGSALSRVLALADDPGRCERIRSHVGDPHTLEHVMAGPSRWADEVVETLYDLCVRRSALTPLFGDGSHDTVDVPGACSDTVAAKLPVWLGEAFLTGSYYDRAERAFERLSDEDRTDGSVERLLGLARVSFKRGAYDEAAAYHEEGLSIARERNDLEGEARHLKGLGLAEWRLGSYERARETFESCHERARTLGDHELELRAEANLGTIAWSQGAYDRARDHFRSFLDHARDTGDRQGEATSLNNLGSVAHHQGAYDRARARHEESLTVRREIGYRSGETSCLNNLGTVARKRGLVQEAAEFHESSLEIAREIGHAREQGHALCGLGVVARQQGDYDAAKTSFDEALAIFEETGNRSFMLRTERERATLALELGEIEEARDRTERVLEAAAESGELYELGRCWKLRGRIAVAEGTLEAAREHARTALELLEELGSYDHALDALELLVETCLEADDPTEARRWLQRGRELSDDAPDETTELHREWIERYAALLEPA